MFSSWAQTPITRGFADGSHMGKQETGSPLPNPHRHTRYKSHGDGGTHMPALNCLHMETQVHARHRPALVHGHVHIYTCTHVHTHTPERKNGLFSPNTTCVPARKPGIWFPGSHYPIQHLTDAEILKQARAPGFAAGGWGLE